ncbi:hypothetical protein B0J12DRAFT_724671 [Macrophomina phaseolina]|uniref:Major facilitator superfamily (MFS) profile domain-containing protein n=1 Tax=Macrophomina phaseolina TaxID=35725 RepID=A0ABQ8GR68_9PEZI|nr:hypothetical protein B0J12DRAFT_724671 [Macrophomina phaseolina]
MNLKADCGDSCNPSTDPMEEVNQQSPGISPPPPGRVSVQARFEKAENITSRHDSTPSETSGTGGWRSWLQKDVIAFFFLGLAAALPPMIVTTGASAMFPGATGAFGLCLTCAAAVTSFTAPMFLHRIPQDVRIIVLLVASVLCLVISTLGSGTVGPVFGSLVGGFVYAFGLNALLASAAFFDHKTVLSLSTGAGFSVVAGPALYIGLMLALDHDWKRTYLVCLPFCALLPLSWWLMLSKDGRETGESSRRATVLGNMVERHRSASTDTDDDDEEEENARVTEQSFGPKRTRVALFLKILLPSYVLPLLVCTLGASLALFGLSPTFQSLYTFRMVPEDDMIYELSFLAYGAAQFLFSLVSSLWPLPRIWLWAIVQTVLVIIGVVQLFDPFLSYFPVWIAFMFVIGGIVGGSVTNTNHKIADDFKRKGEPDDVRSFAMSYGALGNFGGDAIGGAFGIMVQKLALEHLQARA